MLQAGERQCQGQEVGMNVVSPGRLEAGMEGPRREMGKLERGRGPVHWEKAQRCRQEVSPYP